jgi:hypothetical protein
MMAANAANDGSGRCQPKFVSDDEFREMVIHPRRVAMFFALRAVV